MSATIETLEAMERPPVSMGSRLEGELLEVSMGPQHPSTHGVFRMNVALEGEIVRKLKPVFGYLHRNHEKIGENASYLGSMPYTDRLDYFCSMTNNWAYALSVEKLAGIEVHERVVILKQAFEQIPPGPIINPKVKIRAFRPPIGEAYGRIEGPKGELGFYLISDGGPNPYRYRVRPPSFVNLTVLEDLCLGHTVADVMVILGSVDIVMGEVDR